MAWWLLMLLSFQEVLISAQLEQFFFDGFETQSDWKIENTGKANGLEWENSGRCNFLGGPLCLFMTGQGLVSRVISTVGYHTITVYIDIRSSGNEYNEYCYLQYGSNSTAWTNNNLPNGDYQLDINISIPDTDNYNNQSSFQLRLGHSGDTSGDECFFDNLKIFGIAYTNSPTLFPSNNPTQLPFIACSTFHSSLQCNASSVCSWYYDLCRCASRVELDILFMIDGSGSVTADGFQMIKVWMEHIITQEISLSARIGIIIFATDIYETATLRFWNQTDLIQHIHDLTYPNEAWTQTGVALLSALQQFKQFHVSDRHKLLITLTTSNPYASDGYLPSSPYSICPYKQPLLDAGILSVIMGIGKEITSDYIECGTDYYFDIPSVSELNSTDIVGLADILCPNVWPPPLSTSHAIAGVTTIVPGISWDDDFHFAVNNTGSNRYHGINWYSNSETWNSTVNSTEWGILHGWFGACDAACLASQIKREFSCNEYESIDNYSVTISFDVYLACNVFGLRYNRYSKNSGLINIKAEMAYITDTSTTSSSCIKMDIVSTTHVLDTFYTNHSEAISISMSLDVNSSAMAGAFGHFNIQCNPMTLQATQPPTMPTNIPTNAPTLNTYSTTASTANPTLNPTTASPTNVPTLGPTLNPTITLEPTLQPTVHPTMPTRSAIWSTLITTSTQLLIKATTDDSMDFGSNTNEGHIETSDIITIVIASAAFCCVCWVYCCWREHKHKDVSRLRVSTIAMVQNNKIFEKSLTRMVAMQRDSDDNKSPSMNANPIHLSKAVSILDEKQMDLAKITSLKGDVSFRRVTNETPSVSNEDKSFVTDVSHMTRDYKESVISNTELTDQASMVVGAGTYSVQFPTFDHKQMDTPKIPTLKTHMHNISFITITNEENADKLFSPSDIDRHHVYNISDASMVAGAGTFPVPFTGYTEDLSEIQDIDEEETETNIDEEPMPSMASMSCIKEDDVLSKIVNSVT